MGDTGVGKSSLMYRFTEGEFKSSLVGTAGVDYKIKNIEFQGQSVKIQIWDTAGQERYRTLTKSYYKGASGVVLVFDVTDAVSFANIEYWLKKIQKHGDSHAEIIIVGNKKDLVNDRVVSIEQAEEMAERYGIGYFEASAKEDSLNVDKAFKQLLNRVITNEHLHDKISIQNLSGVRGSGNINKLGSIRLDSASLKEKKRASGKDSKCC